MPGSVSTFVNFIDGNCVPTASNEGGIRSREFHAELKNIFIKL